MTELTRTAVVAAASGGRRACAFRDSTSYTRVQLTESTGLSRAVLTGVSTPCSTVVSSL